MKPEAGYSIVIWVPSGDLYPTWTSIGVVIPQKTEFSTAVDPLTGFPSAPISYPLVPVPQQYLSLSSSLKLAVQSSVVEQNLPTFGSSFLGAGGPEGGTGVVLKHLKSAPVSKNENF